MAAKTASSSATNRIQETSPILGRHGLDEDLTHRSREKALLLKVDLRLCSIAGILCSLNLLDSGIISSASVTSMLVDLQLTGNRYSVSIFIFTIASVCFQLPATIAVRLLGPRIFFAVTTFCFGLITICTAFIHTWKEMIAMRILLGIAMSGIYPGLTLLISTWYTRKEQQLRFAFLQSGQVIILATGGIVNFGLNHLNGRGALKGWQWMYLVQGLVSIAIKVILGSNSESPVSGSLYIRSTHLLLGAIIPGELPSRLPFSYSRRTRSRCFTYPT